MAETQSTGTAGQSRFVIENDSHHGITYVIEITPSGREVTWWESVPRSATRLADALAYAESMKILIMDEPGSGVTLIRTDLCERITEELRRAVYDQADTEELHEIVCRLAAVLDAA